MIPISLRILRDTNVAQLNCLFSLAAILLSISGCTNQAQDSIGDVAASAPHSSNDRSEHLPPIDCPLRKAGIDPHKLKPFEEVEKYIAFLERPDRQAWQKPDSVVSALDLKGSETVVDLGAGSGYFTFRLAKVLPSGKVVAIDTEPEMIRHIHHKARQQGVSNLDVQLAAPDDPNIPSQTDVVFVCDVLHHVKNRSEWLAKLYAAMHGGARLVLIEFKAGKLPEGPPEEVKIPKEEMVQLVKTAGFTPVADRADLLPYQEFLVFSKP